jgi:hypothetical protein
MSHFTRVRTQLRDMEMVKRALIDLGYKVTSGSVYGFGGQEARVDLVVRTAGKYDIGFKMEGSNIEMIADFWGIPVDRAEFLRRLTQRYAYLTVTEQARQQGWQTVLEETQPDGSIRLVMQRW